MYDYVNVIDTFWRDTVNIKRTEFMTDVDIDAVPEDERSIALVICIG